MTIAVMGLLIFLLSILCVRFSKTKTEDRRFQLSTILVVMFYVAVFLSFFRLVITTIEREEGPIRFDSWIPLIMSIIGACTFFVFTTMVLLHLGDAAMYTLNYGMRLYRSGKKADES